VRAHQAGDAPRSRGLIDVLAAATDPAAQVAPAVAGLLEAQLAEAWVRGWQPRDLAAVVDRELGRTERALVRRVMASEATGYEALGARVAPDWMGQLAHVGAARDWDPSRPYLLQLAGRWLDVLLGAVRLQSLLEHLPVLSCLVDPPSRWRDGPASAAGRLPDGLLRKVRALLAQAESTTFAAEAETFTAKAQELMARHRIDRSMLAASGHAGDDTPAGRRITVDDPYADAKALLLSVIADVNGCRALWSKPFGFSTVFGFPDELDAVEELYTSLLVQATIALRREGPKRDDRGRSRTKRFRRSFLVAFAGRIGARLRQTVEATVEAATGEHGTALVPILTARSDATRAAAERAFPKTRWSSPSATDAEGWFAGRVFADQADITLRDELARPA
jgi:hypothetical protein